jgi:hypothetical protein
MWLQFILVEIMNRDKWQSIVIIKFDCCGVLIFHIYVH